MQLVIGFTLLTLISITSYVIYDLTANHLPVMAILAFVALSTALIALVIKR